MYAFFDAAWLPEHLHMLRKWRDDVAFGTSNSIKTNPANLLYDHELTVKLIEAAWLLRHGKLGKLNIPIDEQGVIRFYVKKEKKELAHYPQILKLKELRKPSGVLKNIFKVYDVIKYRGILNRWLHDAMNPKFREESLSKHEVIVVYENLVKLIEAMWLINVRSKSGS